MKILVVVDMQNDFIDGSLGSPEAKAIVENVKNKIDNWQGEIIFTQDIHNDNYLETLEGQMLPIKHCINRTEGCEISKQLNIEKRFVVQKGTFGYEYWQDTFYSFDNIEEIELCGLCTDICVVSNALALRMFYPNTKITVDASCCTGVTPYKHKCALEVMRSCQINVIGDDNND